ncbi:hypothetical protein CIJ84_12775 [Neisseria meningitidis]|uniref:Uncharacterized protein n=1 Tax=Neisseria meningitidis TaxID=487 RepID=A0AB37K4Z2_NEIME|nr:hypothetical protein CIJ72_12395 [Neisseria meningitidis]RGA71168.1 hypothetical protein CIJ68_12370 [Neisseria meningitidis]RGA91571.1 hypothetical protein CIJ67_12440 [Neisseria meningitidis]RGA93748.1 hypothetical protein CIJ76_12545 [Neisseria meningitidis]RGB12804.1 hypothetical protein CIJ84_12775 [Neisseria meningitidis]
MFGNHGLGGLLKEGAHEKSPKCLGGNLGDFGEFCKGLRLRLVCASVSGRLRQALRIMPSCN